MSLESKWLLGIINSVFLYMYKQICDIYLHILIVSFYKMIKEKLLIYETSLYMTLIQKFGQS